MLCVQVCAARELRLVQGRHHLLSPSVDLDCEECGLEGGDGVGHIECVAAGSGTKGKEPVMAGAAAGDGRA